MLWTSKLVYVFADLLKEQRDGNVKLDYPSDFPNDILTRFKTESLDFTDLNETGNGMPFGLILEILNRNIDKVKNIRVDNDDGDYVEDILEDILERRNAHESPENDSYFLETFRSIKSDRQCVYGIVKDTNSKKIVIAFRGSLMPGQNLDWQSNFNSFYSKMKTPKLLRNKLKGKLSKELLVHRGFYEYLFDNKAIETGGQRYDVITGDLEKILEKHAKDGYKIWVTGHSLGAALSSVTAFKLAGSGKEWIPKPITCVSYASPFTGGAGYKKAFQQLEKDGMLRYLRFTNNNDPIPSSPIALSWRRFKHVGVNIRLYDNNVQIHHSSKTGWKYSFQNSLVKPLWSTSTMHSLKLHEKRMHANRELLTQMTFEDLYKDLW